MKVANNFMERWSISLIIKEMQIKTIMQYYYTSIEIAQILKTGNNK